MKKPKRRAADVVAEFMPRLHMARLSQAQAAMADTDSDCMFNLAREIGDVIDRHETGIAMCAMSEAIGLFLVSRLDLADVPIEVMALVRAIAQAETGYRQAAGRDPLTPATRH